MIVGVRVEGVEPKVKLGELSWQSLANLASALNP